MTIPGLIIEPRPPFSRFVTVETVVKPDTYPSWCPDCGYSLETCQCERLALGGDYSSL